MKLILLYTIVTLVSSIEMIQSSYPTSYQANYDILKVKDFDDLKDHLDKRVPCDL